MADVLSNRASFTLAAAITSATQTSITRTSATDGLPGDSNGPASGTYVFEMTDGSGNYELARVTGGQGTTTLTIARAVELIGGTQTALASVPSGTVCYAVATAGDLVTNPMTTLNDLIVGGASGAPTRLGVGSAGQVLKVLGGGGLAVLFNGSTGYIQAPYVQPALATLSFMVWLNVPSTGIGGSNPAIFDTAGFYSTATGCGLGYNLGTGTQTGVDFALNAGSRVTVTDPVIPTENIWYCYVCTYDGTTMTMYRQGVSVATGTNSGSCAASATDLLIATSPSRTNRYWGGLLAHIAFWPGVVLTATEASDLYSLASTDTEAEYETYVESLSPALYYPLQDSTTTALNKGTDGSADNGVYSGGYTQGETGPVTTPANPYIGWG